MLRHTAGDDMGVRGSGGITDELKIAAGKVNYTYMSIASIWTLLGLNYEVY